MGTHWKKLTNPDYLGSYAFEPGEKKVVTISQIREETVTGSDGKQDVCIVAHFREPVKPMILNATNCKAIARLYRTPIIEEWVGKPIVLRVERVRAFGEVVEAVRIAPERPRTAGNGGEVCEECGTAISPFKGRTAADVAAHTRSRYGRQLCATCAEAVAQKGQTVI